MIAMQKSIKRMGTALKGCSRAISYLDIKKASKVTQQQEAYNSYTHPKYLVLSAMMY